MIDNLISPNRESGFSRTLSKSAFSLTPLLQNHSRLWSLWAVAFLCTLLLPLLTCAQSTVVTTDSDAEVPTNGQSLTVDRVPSDLSPTIKAVERRLATATPETWRSERPFGSLVEDMNRAGYRIFLHESAIDNNLDTDSYFRLALHNASIEENLRFALDAYQCEYYLMDSGTIVIASMDYVIENPVRVTFDVTNLPQDPFHLAESIEESIGPDGWEVNGGTGRMQVVTTNDRRLIVVVTTYQNMRQVRSQLGTFSAMTGAKGLPASQGLLAGASTPVRLPGDDDDSGYGRGYRSGRGGGLGGGGGGGLGGGVF